MKSRCLTLFPTYLTTALLLAASVPDALGQFVAHYPDPGQSFAERFGWATNKARDAQSGRAWIGFEITRRMPVGSNFVSTDRWSFHGSNWDHDGITLYELVEGRRPRHPAESDQDIVREAARMVLEELGRAVPEQEYVDRRVGVLLGVDTNAGAANRWDALWLGNVEMEFSQRGRTLLWLGTADAVESVAFLTTLLDRASEDVRERIVRAIGVHSAPEVVVPALETVLREDPGSEVREAAADGLSRQRTDAALDALIWAAIHDSDREVREECIDALARFPSNRATAALIDRAKNDDHREVREEAVEALAARHTESALQTLLDIAFEDPDRRVREEAVEAIARFPRQQSIPALTKIVTEHPSENAREEAVEAFRMSGSAEAITTLARVARNDPSGSVQEEALEALLALPDEQGVAALASIVQSHPRAAIRSAAKELLENSSGPQARRAAAALAQ